ncbi:amidase [Coniella lustricola]|uniref:Amidase n=1 Tax=Coniella lustricola TaxID=2025994 RepID=A0A2T3A4E3_9PEZI|nr:amidase [Coniella lustricola]
MGSTKRSWQEIVVEKRQAQADYIARLVQEDGGHRQESPMGGLAFIKGHEIGGSLCRKDYRCEELIMSSIQRACEIHKTTNCLTEVCFDEALLSSRALDEHLNQEHKLVGPLHGVPTTLKDQFNIKGLDTTLGYVGRALAPAEDDAALVKMLRALGAVILAKSNLPQSIMWCETDNPLWGLTTNPFDSNFTPGGSTGGEGVLVSCGASALGFGTDIGGSIRIPSHMMGIYGLKPSSSRLPYEGVPVSTEGQEHVPSSVGPMASTLETIHLAMKSLIDLKPWEFDSRCSPISWRSDMYDQVLSRPLVFGVVFDDGVARPHPPVTRVLQSAIKALEAAGHSVIEWNTDFHKECIELMDEYYTADGGEDVRSAVTCGGEPFIEHVEKLINRGQPISVYEYWQLNRRKWALQNAYLKKWQSTRTPDGRLVDAIIMPTMPHTAVPHKSCRWVGYTKVWNVLDYTALTIPAGHVVQEDLEAAWNFKPRGEIDEWCLGLWQQGRRRMAELALPVGLQIVGRKLEEEKVLGVGKVVDDILQSAKRKSCKDGAHAGRTIT